MPPRPRGGEAARLGGPAAPGVHHCMLESTLLSNVGSIPPRESGLHTLESPEPAPPPRPHYQKYEPNSVVK